MLIIVQWGYPSQGKSNLVTQLHPPTHTHTHQQGLSQAAWCFSAAQGAAWSKHQQTFCVPPLFLFLPSRKQYPPKNIASYGTMPSLLVLHWTENWQNKTYYFLFLCAASLWHRPKKCNREWQLGRLIGSCWIEESWQHPGFTPWLEGSTMGPAPFTRVAAWNPQGSCSPVHHTTLFLRAEGSPSNASLSAIAKLQSPRKATCNTSRALSLQESGL